VITEEERQYFREQCAKSEVPPPTDDQIAYLKAERSTANRRAIPQLLFCLAALAGLLYLAWRGGLFSR
jgi:hypothetical protein